MYRTNVSISKNTRNDYEIIDKEKNMITCSICKQPIEGIGIIHGDRAQHQHCQKYQELIHKITTESRGDWEYTENCGMITITTRLSQKVFHGPTEDLLGAFLVHFSIKKKYYEGEE